jgi:S-adenosylmethionine-diacylglycerol 3-amino-3-carboxypropyl transferase
MTEVAAAADFSHIRYAQCWEDADILTQALALKPGAHCLSIASAGDNSFSLLAAGAGRVVAVDLNPAQIACVELRRAAWRVLEHGEFLQLLGARECADRASLYRRCAPMLPDAARRFWDAHPALIAGGHGSAGKFERYFETFRRRVLPLVHRRKNVLSLLEPRTPEARRAFYQREWNTWRWRALFRVFFSRFVMGRLGRDPRFFKYVEGSVADRILSRTRHALETLDPSQNPYLHWILTGTFRDALPHALREEHYLTVRSRLNDLVVHTGSIESWLEAHPQERFDGFNLSDIFEYMSEESMAALYGRLLAAANPGARLVYWNMLAPRQCPPCFVENVARHAEEAAALLKLDKAWFYSALHIEEVKESA